MAPNADTNVVFLVQATLGVRSLALSIPRAAVHDVKGQEGRSSLPFSLRSLRTSGVFFRFAFGTAAVQREGSEGRGF